MARRIGDGRKIRVAARAVFLDDQAIERVRREAEPEGARTGVGSGRRGDRGAENAQGYCAIGGRQHRAGCRRCLRHRPAAGSGSGGLPGAGDCETAGADHGGGGGRGAARRPADPRSSLQRKPFGAVRESAAESPSPVSGRGRRPVSGFKFFKLSRRAPDLPHSFTSSGKE